MYLHKYVIDETNASFSLHLLHVVVVVDAAAALVVIVVGAEVIHVSRTRALSIFLLLLLDVGARRVYVCGVRLVFIFK